MSGVKNLVQADTKGMKPITNEMLKEEAMESQNSSEEVSEKK
jgi:hypothetical protein